MTLLPVLPRRDTAADPRGTGVLTSGQGNFPLTAMSVDADITGLLGAMTVRQTFHNPYDHPIEAIYIFPLPDRAAVTGLVVTIGKRRIEGVLQERQAAREAYDQALADGLRAGLVEEDRPDVFTTSLGNLAPGEEATVELSLAGPVPCELDEATFRVPLVVAPRYIPGRPLDGDRAGDGTALDTDAVPDASRITPPVLVPGGPNPVRLSVTVRLDPAGVAVSDLRSSLHGVTVTGELPGPVTVELGSGERLDRDFILRYRTVEGAADGSGAEAGGGRRPRATAVAVPDADTDGSDGSEGTYVVTVLPPGGAPAAARDVVLLLDRSGSMGGWKMVAARRAAARIVDSLTSADRFAVRAFDHTVERPGELGDGLVTASDRNRYQAVEWLSRLEARGGTELAAALEAAQAILAQAGDGDGARARSWILVTDGQVGDEDRLVRLAADAGVRLFTVGIDQAVNAGLLRRLAAVTGGRCDLVESEDRLDTVLTSLQRRIGQPVLEAVTVRFVGLDPEADTATPSRAPDLYPGVPLVLSGRFQGRPGGEAVVSAGDGTTITCPVVAATSPAAPAVWARAHLRDLEDRYAALAPTSGDARPRLAERIVSVSLRHRVLCRFTAWVAIDQSGQPVEGSRNRVVQPVETPAGWAAASGASGGPVQATWMAAPTAAPIAARRAASPEGPLPASAPHLPPAPPGSPAPARAGSRFRMPPSPPVPPPFPVPAAPEMGERPEVSLAPYHQRAIDLLAGIADADLSDPSLRARLAGDAWLLADDIRSVVDDSPLVALLEALAGALAAGQPGAVEVRARRLRVALESGEAGAGDGGDEQHEPAGGRRGRRTRLFWR